MAAGDDIENGGLADLVRLSSSHSDRASKRRSASSKNRDTRGEKGKKDVAISNHSASELKKEENIIIKYGSLFLLVAQMVGLVLLMRYSRTRTSVDGEMYLASTAVFIMEVMKFIICIGVIFFSSGLSISSLSSELNTHIWMSPFEVLKLCVPSLLYAVQNNLLYIALTNLDAATYQVCYQLKILTTAIFSAILLKVCHSVFLMMVV
uniref:Uncharacterized protein n=1 Tax=Ditylum brightwellii TaxID=49249 RepID=A0A7S4W4U4_9STRA